MTLPSSTSPDDRLNVIGPGCRPCRTSRHRVERRRAELASSSLLSSSSPLCSQRSSLLVDARVGSRAHSSNLDSCIGSRSQCVDRSIVLLGGLTRVGKDRTGRGEGNRPSVEIWSACRPQPKHELERLSRSDGAHPPHRSRYLGCCSLWVLGTWTALHKRQTSKERHKDFNHHSPFSSLSPLPFSLLD